MVLAKNLFGIPSDENGKDIGIFLPMANHGWILSKNAPDIDGSWELCKEVALLAENAGFDFIMSMAKYRGYGGEIEPWKDTLDANLLIAAIAAITTKTRLITTIHTVLQNPAVAAKIISTLDKICHGRAGLNVVNGAYKDEFAQMGAWPNTSYEERYNLAVEWIQDVKALWKEPSLTRKGKYFKLEDCVSSPKPDKQPFLICAGITEHEINFCVNETDAIFLSGKTDEELAKITKVVKEKGAEKNREIRAYTHVTLVMDETDAKAHAREEYYSEGLDEGALKGMLKAYGFIDSEIGKGENDFIKSARSGFMTPRVVGSVENVGDRLLEIFERTKVDGMMVVFPDYLNDLPVFSEYILPRIRAEFSYKPSVNETQDHRELRNIRRRQSHNKISENVNSNVENYSESSKDA